MDDVSFSVRPVTNNLELEAGGTATGEITIINPDYATDVLNYLISIAPYSVVGESYRADLVATNEHTMMTDWITIAEPEGSLEPGEKKTIEYKISVPSDAPGGGQYSAILVDALPKEGETPSTVKAVYEISHIIYANVKGETYHYGEILGNDIPSVATKTPISISTLLTNTGNTHEYANIDVAVKNALNGEEIYSEGEASVSEVIMPNSTRLFKRDITNLPSLGIVDITQTIMYGNQVSTVTSRVYICPLWFAVLVAVALVGIVWGVIKTIKRPIEKEVE